MPKKSKTRKQSTPFPKNFEPFVFEMGFFPDGNGSLLVRYESSDDRADEVCGAVIQAIAASLGLIADEATTV